MTKHWDSLNKLKRHGQKILSLLSSWLIHQGGTTTFTILIGWSDLESGRKVPAREWLRMVDSGFFVKGGTYQPPDSSSRSVRDRPSWVIETRSPFVEGVLPGWLFDRRGSTENRYSGEPVQEEWGVNLEGEVFSKKMTVYKDTLETLEQSNGRSGGSGNRRSVFW